jgi:MtN3 and saliva related transmembrane protein
MDLSEALGYAAGFLTTIAFIPQVLKIWKSKSAEDVSFATFAAFTVGVVLWLLYGIARQEPPIIIWNSVTLVLAIAILVMKVKYKAR